MGKTTLLFKINLSFLVMLLMPFFGFSQTLTSPQVSFLQRTSAADPAQTIYNIKGDFTLIGNTNLTLLNYSASTDNEGNTMRYVDVDGDPTTLNSSMSTLELSNSGENSANQNCSNILFAGLYWTGKSDDANETFSISNTIAVDGATIPYTNYIMTVSIGGTSKNFYPIYTFTANGHDYAFSFTNNTSGSSIVTLKIDGGSATDIPVVYSSGTAIFSTPYTSNTAWGSAFTINSLIRNTSKSYSLAQYQSSSSANVTCSPLKNYNKKSVSLKGPGDTTYSTITTTSAIRYPGTSNSGIFIGYQEITNYVKAHGPGAYTVADIALIEGNNGSPSAANPGYSGGWSMIVIYDNPVMNSRAVTLFDGYAYVNGQTSGGGEYGTIPISGFTTVGSGQVNMKLGVMAAEGDVALSGDYLAVQKLNANPSVYPGNYLVLNHANNSTNNFFNSSIFPTPAAGNSNPNLQNNTGVDFSMFTIPNAGNSVIGNNQTSTTFRFGSTSEVYTIFGFAMSVDAYIPEPKGLTTVNASPGQSINYTLSITNEGTEATNNTLISIPIPVTSIFQTGTIVYHTYNGFTPGTTPVYNSATNTITWNLGTLPVTANHPEYIYADISFTLEVTNDCGIILNAGCNPVVSLETGTIKGTGATSGSPFTKYFFQGYDTSSCHLPIMGSVQVAINGVSCTSAMAGSDQVSACGGENVSLAATAGTAGTWSIVSGPYGGGENFTNSTSPNSEFYSENPGVYTLRWTSTSCGSHYDDVLATISLCNVVNFDGTDDNINFKNNFNLNSGNFTIESWIKSNAANGSNQTILSKHLSPNSTDGYDLKVVNNLISFNWNNHSITATHTIGTNRWYHIAVTYDGTNYRLYIDGILDKTTTGQNPSLNSVDFILGAMSQNSAAPYNYYNGYTDELRIWKVSLTVDQIRKMMNQEIENDGNGNVIGVIIPKTISGLSWANLAAYFQMNRASDINNGYLIDKSGNGKNGKLKSIYVQEPDTAPLPYTSRANSSWETNTTWTNYPVWDVPNGIGIDGTTKIDWNIVKTSHNITSNGNKTVLGLFVSSNTISATNDSKIEISSYLKLDGKIDLVGKSQLLQTTESDLDANSSGYIERDQQGQSNKYNYNYWSSPVSPINTIANNTNYSVAGVMKDGINAIPRNIIWISGYDGIPGDTTTPTSLARYWLFKFESNTDAYANWIQFLETASLRVGQGYTLKASGAATNYTFVGKPNNGTITTNIVGANQLLLVGNPYPSAIDAYQFLDDNVSSVARSATDGTLYFWQHAPENNTHILSGYLGSYGLLNYSGGIAAVAPSGIAGSGTAAKIPNQYIPVGQGFFVYGSTTGGAVTFKNSQRAFKKEDDVASNSMFKTKSNTNKTSNDESVSVKKPYKKIRLGYNTNNNYHRQVLLAFMGDRATSAIDYGYDAASLDDIPNDMYFLNGENQLVIEGEGYFDANASYPIGVKTDVEGKVSFTIDALENFDAKQKVYLYDSETNTYNEIQNALFEVNMPIGVDNTRFSLRFKHNNSIYGNKTLSVDENNPISNDIKVMHIQNENTLVITNTTSNVSVEKISLFNILGQSVANWQIENQEQKTIQIPIKNINNGVYIIKLKTSKGEINKKIIL